MTYPMAATVPVTKEVSETLLAAPRRARDPVRAEGTGGGSGHSSTHGPARQRRGRCRTTCSSGSPCTTFPKWSTCSGLAVDGWVPVDQTNLATRFPGVYALGDAAGGPRTVAKAGVFAEAAARVVAEAHRRTRPRRGESPAPYEGDGTCYIEFGGGIVGKVEANFLGGPAPTARIIAPSRELAVEKERFAASRRQRWFGPDADAPIREPEEAR